MTGSELDKTPELCRMANIKWMIKNKKGGE
jgi:hypothetical protein